MREVTRREEYRYAKVYFYSRAIFITLILVFIFILWGRSFYVSLLWLSLLAVLSIMAIFFFGLSPLLTSHWVTRSRLILRRGWFFKAIIPISNIASVTAYDSESKLGLNLSFYSRTLYITSSRHDLVEVRLKRPRRFAQMFGLVAIRIVINVDRREDFIKSIREKIALLTPVETYSSDAQLGD